MQLARWERGLTLGLNTGSWGKYDGVINSKCLLFCVLSKSITVMCVMLCMTGKSSVPSEIWKDCWILEIITFS